jgi:hypothetical protein
VSISGAGGMWTCWVGVMRAGIVGELGLKAGTSKLRRASSLRDGICPAGIWMYQMDVPGSMILPDVPTRYLDRHGLMVLLILADVPGSSR